jgi:predicted small secreted protein
MFHKIATVALIGAALAIAACNTVRGAASDVNSVANCTENAINGSTPCSVGAGQGCVLFAMVVPDLKRRRTW